MLVDDAEKAANKMRCLSKRRMATGLAAAAIVAVLLMTGCGGRAVTPNQALSPLVGYWAVPGDRPWQQTLEVLEVREVKRAFSVGWNGGWCSPVPIANGRLVAFQGMSSATVSTPRVELWWHKGHAILLLADPVSGSGPTITLRRLSASDYAKVAQRSQQ